MKKLKYFVCKAFLLFIFSYAFTAKGQTVPVSDSLALVALYNATDGDNWTRNDNWLIGPVNTWYGINVWQGNVNFVDLWDNNLTGILPSEIGDLSQLKYLYLGYNHLSGMLPSEIGNLLNLRQLNIKNNEFSGEIHKAISDLPALDSVALEYNHFTDIYYGFRSPNRILGLGNNNFTFEDIIPYANYNNISYSPQDSIGQDTTISVMEGKSIEFRLHIDDTVSSNKYVWFKGGVAIDTTNWNEYLLSNVSFSDAGVYTCEVTNYHYRAPNLTLYSRKITLVVTENSNRTVAIQDSLALVALYNATEGENWTRNDNWLTGPVNTWEGINVFQKRVNSIDLWDNNLNGSLPAEIGDLSELIYLYIGNNQLHGTLPAEIGNLTNLKHLNVRNNELGGEIPEEITDLPVLDSVAFEYNHFTGIDYISYKPNLTVGLSNNNFTFEDILRYSWHGIYSYYPQDSIGQDTTVYITEGGSFTFRLYIDDTVSNNKYVWFKDNNRIDSTHVNQYTFSNITSSDAGIYTCEVTNPYVPYLTLYSKKITLVVIEDSNRTVAIQDSLALVALYNATDGDNWYEKHRWLTGLANTWSGLWVLDKRVRNLLFYNNNLVGKIPAQLGDLDSLTYIYFSNNSLQGEIPEALFNLPILDSVFISNNHITSIPNTSNLSFIHLRNNDLTFEDLLNYEFAIYDSQNAFGKDTVFQIIEGQEFIIDLEIDEEVSDNRYIWFKDSIAIDTTQVNTFKIPDVSLSDSGVYTCQVTNPNLPLLTLSSHPYTLVVEEDSIENRMVVIQDSLALVALYNSTNGDNWTRNDNWLVGPVNTWDGIGIEDKKVRYIYLTENNLSGTLPPEIGNFEQPYELYLNKNNIGGTIPNEIGNLQEINILDLSENNLTGNIPPEIGNIQIWMQLLLNDNLLEGEIPGEIGNFSYLLGLDLSNNQLEGALPVELKNLNKIDSLLVNNNNLEGPIPFELFNIPTWNKFNFSNNNFTGEIPAIPKGQYVAARILLLNNNQIEQIAPQPLDNRLYEVDLSNNLLKEIPDFSGHSYLEGLFGKLRVGRNSLTFRSILNNLSIGIFSYSPQTNFGQDTTIYIPEGENYTIDLGIDEEVIDNTYIWYKDSIAIDTTNVNKLTVSLTTLSDAGVYTCEVTNPNAPDLTLYSKKITLVVTEKSKQNITFDSLADKSFGDPNINLTASANSGLPIDFSIEQGQDSVVVFVNDTTLQIVGAGEVTIKTSQEGNENYLPATPVFRSFTVEKADQFITFNPLENKTFGDAPIQLIASASSGFPINFEADGPVVMEGDSLIISGAGQVTVIASQAGNKNYNAASSVERGFTVAKANQTITFDSIPDKVLGDAPFTITATATSGLEIGFAVSVPAIWEDNVLSLTDTGTVIITASQAGNHNYLPAEDVIRTFSVTAKDKEVDTDSVYFLSGNIVNMMDEPVNTGEIILFRLDSVGGWTVYMKQSLTNSNSFHFENLAKGTYTFLAKAVDTSYLPTYFGHHLMLADAAPIVLQHALTEQNIILFTKPSDTPQGEAVITGTLLHDETGEGSRLLSNDGTPLPGVFVYLTEKETGNLIAYDVTDANGTFQFSGLAEGQYQLLAGYEGLSSHTSENIITVSSNTDALAVVAKITEKLEIVSIEQTNEVTGVQDHYLVADQGFKVYPTFVDNDIAIDFTLNKWQGGTVILSDLSGKKLEEKNINSEKMYFDLSNISSGMYLVILKTNQKTEVVKIIK